eukprot:TRINITY_DN6025_c0_g1_i1.p1 TRINITY_DN6025_c0_g1~~TRINITY_DN6025_c0_g1_i1.p1  ORF type:complete len:301 (-),score=40.39 TRINITY_DN6025_c0_g1_i1:84-953(-)
MEAAMRPVSVFLLICTLLVSCVWSQPFTPIQGVGTATHYNIAGQPGSCNCAYNAYDLYPTAALSQQQFGAASANGPACGACYRIKPYGDPYDASFCSDSGPEVVVKVTDLCPIQGNVEWCQVPNQHGGAVHFDLNEKHIPAILNWRSGQGTWKIQYCQVPCSQWDGFNDDSTVGINYNFGNWGACPRDVYGSGGCNFQSMCGGSPPPPSGGLPGDLGVVWNPDTQLYWLGFKFNYNMQGVQVNCGQGFVGIGWDGYQWSFSPQGYSCPTTIPANLLYNGVWYPFTLYRP